jgi:Ca2+-binding RTX toxin-like protein
MAKGQGGGGGGGGGPRIPPDLIGTVGNDVLTIVSVTNGGKAFGLAGDDTLNGSIFGDVLVGGDGNDRLFGNDGFDTLEGGAGNDFMDGGTGSDIASYANELAGVRVDLAITTAQNTLGSGFDTLINIEWLTGSAFNDMLFGSDIQNIINGGAGNDVIDARGGDDLLHGGLGNDTMLGGAGNDSIYDTDGSNTVDGGIGNDYIVMGAGDDNVNGGDGDDDINGGLGNDRLLGGTGNDLFHDGTGNNFIDGGLGTDTVYFDFLLSDLTIDLRVTTAQNTGASGISTILNVEDVVAGYGNDVITGNAVANFINGGGGTNILSGGGGNDTIWSLGFGDTLNGDAGNDTLVGGHTLNGGIGNDILAGDIMTGGAGADRFQERNTGSVVTDFSRVQGDKIDLAGLSANFGPLNFVGYAPFDSFVGHNEVHVLSGVGFQMVEIDINGDRVSDFTMQVTGNTPLVVSDFIL